MAKRNVTVVQDSVNGLETTNGINIAQVTGTPVDNAIARFDGTSGAIQGSGVVVDDSGNLIVPTGIFTEQRDEAGPAGVVIDFPNYLGTDGRITSRDTNTSAYKNLQIAALNTVFVNGGFERMRIDSSGNVGIGTSSPASKLHSDFGTLTDSGVREIIVQSKADGSTYYVNSPITGITFTNWSNGYTAGSLLRSAGVYGYNSDYNNKYGRRMGLVFYTSALDSIATEKMRIDSDGNLGLGVTPSAWKSDRRALDIGAGASVVSSGVGVSLFSNTYLNTSSQWTYKNTSSAGFYDVGGNVHTWYTAPSGTAGDAIAWTTAMTLNGNGNLGLGVTPSAWASYYKVIDIGSSTGQMALYGRTDGNNSGFTQNAYRNASNVWTYKANGYAFFNEITSGGSYWYTAPSGTAGNPITWTTAMMLGADGNLTIKSPTSVDSILAIDATSTNVAQRLHFKANGTLQAEVYNDSTQTIIKTVTNTPLKLGTNNIASVVIPTTGGIQLPNTAIAGATTLDWYEEATATLTATGMTTAPTGTAKLTRIGNTVTIEIPAISGTSNATTFTLGTLPTNFIPTAARHCVAVTQDNGGSMVFARMRIETNGVITLYKDAAGNPFTASGVKSVYLNTTSYHI